MEIKGAIFDFDGTIIDSMPMWTTLASRYIKSLGREPKPGIDALLKTMTLEEGADIFRRDYGAKGTNQEIVEYVLSIAFDEYSQKIPLKDGVLDVLEDLYANDVKMCVATATNRYMVEPAIERLGLNKYFSKLFTCQEIGNSKREPDIYFEAGKHLNTEIKSTLVFEDVMHAVETAYNAGFPVVGVYDRASAEERGQIESMSRIYLNDYSEWPGVKML